MITPALVRRILTLLTQDGLSQRQAARRVGVSRGTVAAIVSGRRLPSSPDRPPLPAGESESSGLPERCPQCGGLVLMPCVRCHVEQAMRRASPRCLPPANDDLQLQLQLAGPWRQRYEEVRACRLAQPTDEESL